MRSPVRVAVLGNSHLAAAKLGWDLIREEHSEFELTFFGAPGLMMGDLALDGMSLTPTTGRLRKKLASSSGGHDRITPSDFDRFILYGLQFGPRRILELYRTFRPISFEWRGQLERLHPFRRSVDPLQTISEAFFEAAALSALGASHAVTIAKDLRALTDARIDLVSAPGFSELALETGHWDGPLGAGDIERLSARTANLMRRACPDTVPLVTPGPDLTVHGVFTAALHVLQSPEGERQDHMHTAPSYGAKILRGLLSQKHDSPTELEAA